MSDVTVIVTSFRHGEHLRRAFDSVYAQTLNRQHVSIQPLGGRATGWEGFAEWYEAALSTDTPYVAILHDDDWYEPTFLERCLERMGPGVAYVVSEATIHFPGNMLRLNWASILGKVEPRYRADVWGDILLQTRAVPSPSSCLYRREDLLRFLQPGPPAGLPRNEVFCGPDLLMALLPLLEYERVEVITEPLVNFDGHDESTTIAELKRDGGRRLSVNYDSARKLYSLLRSAR